MSATRKRKLRREVLNLCLNVTETIPLRVPLRHVHVRAKHNQNLNAIRDYVSTVADRSAFDQALARRLRNHTLARATELALRDII